MLLRSTTLDNISTDLDDPAKAANLLNATTKPGFRKGLVEYWVNSILSGPQTHVANIVGNSFTSLLQVPEEAVAAGLQKTGIFGKKGEKLTQRGVGERAYGLLSGINDGIRAAGLSLRNEGAATAFAKIEQQPAIPGKLGSIVRIPGRLLGASDEFFKTSTIGPSSAPRRPTSRRRRRRRTCRPV